MEQGKVVKRAGDHNNVKLHFSGQSRQNNMLNRGRFDTQDSVISENHLQTSLDKSDNRISDMSHNPVHYCEVCDITCTGLASLETHLKGQKHAKKLRLKQGAERVKKMENEFDSDETMALLPGKKKRIAMIQAEFDNCDQPLIGLDYVTEFQKEDFSVEPLYICDLCEVKCDCRQLLFHVTGLKHRMKYFKYHSPEDYKLLLNKMKKSEKAKVALHCAQVLEGIEGRHKVRLKVERTCPAPSLLGSTSHNPDDAEIKRWEEVEVDGTRNIHDLPGLWKCDMRDCNTHGHIENEMHSDLARPYSQRFQDPFDSCERPPVLPPSERTMVPSSVPCERTRIEPVIKKDVTSSHDSNPEQEEIKKFLEGICSVENEEDAEVALQVSNALTKALLEYRMKSLEGTSSMQDTLDEVKRELKNLSKKAKSIPIPKKDSHINVTTSNNDSAGESMDRNTIMPSSQSLFMKTSRPECHQEELAKNEQMSDYSGCETVKVKSEPGVMVNVDRTVVSMMNPNSVALPQTSSSSQFKSSPLIKYSSHSDVDNTHNVQELLWTSAESAISVGSPPVLSVGQVTTTCQTSQCCGKPETSQARFCSRNDQESSLSSQSAKVNMNVKSSGLVAQYGCSYQVSDRSNELQRLPPQQSYKNFEHMAYSTAEDRSLSLTSQCVQPTNNLGQYRQETYGTHHGRLYNAISEYQKSISLPKSALKNSLPITATSSFGCLGSAGSHHGQPSMAASAYSKVTLCTAGCRQSGHTVSEHNQPGLGKVEYQQLEVTQYDKLLPVSTQYGQLPVSQYGQPTVDILQYSKQTAVSSQYDQSQPVMCHYTEAGSPAVPCVPPQPVPTDVASSPQYVAYLASPEYKAYLVLYHTYMAAKAKAQEQQLASTMTSSSISLMSANVYESQPAPPPLPKEPPPPPPPPPPSPPPTTPDPKRQRKV